MLCHQKPVYVRQVGNKLEVPRSANLVYRNQQLFVIQDNKVLRLFCGIKQLFFFTGFNGTRSFKGSARVPKDTIFGGGK